MVTAQNPWNHEGQPHVQQTTHDKWLMVLQLSVQHCWLVYMGDWVKDRQLVRLGLHSRDTGRPSMQIFHLLTCLGKTA